jgi:hypothetical protein
MAEDLPIHDAAAVRIPFEPDTEKVEQWIERDLPEKLRAAIAGVIDEQLSRLADAGGAAESGDRGAPRPASETPEVPTLPPPNADGSIPPEVAESLREAAGDFREGVREFRQGDRAGDPSREILAVLRDIADKLDLVIATMPGGG